MAEPSLSSAERQHLRDLSRKLIAAGSKSFAAASALFEPQTRDLARLLYAWCRHCDDVIDGQSLGHASLVAADLRQADAKLAELRTKTSDALAGRAREPVFQALAAVVEARAIPSRYPMDLLEGFAMDVAGRRYRTLDDTLTYCYHVAGSVGVMMAMIMGVRDADSLHRASDLGIAFQLTNIARDVAPDAKTGRVYLPESWLKAKGLSPQRIGQCGTEADTASVVRDLLELADCYYASASVGIGRLAPRSAWAVTAARDIYRSIGIEVRRRGPAAWDERVAVPKSRKMALIMRSGLATASRTIRWHDTSPRPVGLWTMPNVDA